MTSRDVLLAIAKTGQAFKISREVVREDGFLQEGTLNANDLGGFAFTTQLGEKTFSGQAGENAWTILREDPPAVGVTTPSRSIIVASEEPDGEHYKAWMDLLDSKRRPAVPAQG